MPVHFLLIPDGHFSKQSYCLQSFTPSNENRTVFHIKMDDCGSWIFVGLSHSCIYLSPRQWSKDVLISGCSANDWWRQDNWISSMNTLSLSTFYTQHQGSQWLVPVHTFHDAKIGRDFASLNSIEHWMAAGPDTLFSSIDCCLHVRECHHHISLSTHCFKLTSFSG